MHGQNEVPLETLWADVRPQAQTYDQKHSREHYFGHRPIALVFLLYGCFSGLKTNRRFFTNLENPDHLEKYLKTLFDPGEYQNMHIYNSHDIHSLHMNSNFF